MDRCFFLVVPLLYFIGVLVVPLLFVSDVFFVQIIDIKPVIPHDMPRDMRVRKRRPSIGV